MSETEPIQNPKSKTQNLDVSQSKIQKGAMGIGAASLLALSGCGALRNGKSALTGTTAPTFAPASKHESADAARRVLNRVAFGPNPGDVARVAETGVGNYLEEQLADILPENQTVAWRVDGLETQQDVLDAPDTLDNLSDSQLLIETQQAALLRAVYSTRQLRETLGDFWTNHFNIFALKNDERVLLPTDAERAIRPHILGKFWDLLNASAHSPAMLSYLDNQLNKRGVANENYGRELLELHTLGVHSGYTQKDIQEVARCFTGWRVRKGFAQMNLTNLKTPYNGFEFGAYQHDNGVKYIPFLNLTIAAGGGQKDGDAVLERLATHPATARFLATKLCNRYLGHAPKDVVEKAASAYLKNDTDIRALLRPILLDNLPKTGTTKPILKRPLEFTISALRTLGADTNANANLQEPLAAMGQALYQWPMPDGFPEKQSAWTGSLLGRWNFAMALTANGVSGTTIDLPAISKAFHADSDSARLDALIETIYQTSAAAPELTDLRQTVNQHIKKARTANLAENSIFAEAAGLLLAAPAFQWK